jgi:hypothetical protein
MTMDMFHLSQKLLGHFLIYVFSQMCNYINTTGAINGALTAVFSGVYVIGWMRKEHLQGIAMLSQKCIFTYLVLNNI